MTTTQESSRDKRQSDVKGVRCPSVFDARGGQEEKGQPGWWWEMLMAALCRAVLNEP